MLSRTWTGKEVADRFEEAIYTMRRLPPVRMQGYRTVWPSVVYTEAEIMQQAKLPMRLGPPSAAAIDRLEEVFTWVSWLSVDVRKLVWMRAANMPWRVIGSKIGYSHTTAQREWLAAMVLLSKRLNASTMASDGKAFKVTNRAF